MPMRAPHDLALARSSCQVSRRVRTTRSAIMSIAVVEVEPLPLGAVRPPVEHLGLPAAAG